MSVLVNKDSKVIVQGFTGTEGTFHAGQMIEYGTNVVGGVTPGKGGSEHLGKPVFNTVAESVEKAGANVSIIFVPPAFASDAIMEAADAGIKVIITITEGIPVADMIKAYDYIQGKDQGIGMDRNHHRIYRDSGFDVMERYPFGERRHFLDVWRSCLHQRL